MGLEEGPVLSGSGGFAYVQTPAVLHEKNSVLLRITGVRDAESRNRENIEVTEYDGALSLPVAKRVLKWLRIRRERKRVRPGDELF